MVLGRHTAEAMAAAFEVSPDLFLNLDKAWREYSARRALSAGQGEAK
jgi:hypothetical protein